MAYSQLIDLTDRINSSPDGYCVIDTVTITS